MAHTRLVLLAVCYSTFGVGRAETTCDSSLGFNAKTLNCNSCDEMKEFGLSKALQNACTERLEMDRKMNKMAWFFKKYLNSLKKEQQFEHFRFYTRHLFSFQNLTFLHCPVNKY